LDPAWITAIVALAVAVTGCIAWAGRWSWRLLRGTARFLDDYFGEPEHNGLCARPGVMARLGSVEDLLAKVVAETTPNGGGNLRDVVRRIAADVADIKNEQMNMRARMELFETQRAGREGKP